MLLRRLSTNPDDSDPSPNFIILDSVSTSFLMENSNKYLIPQRKPISTSITPLVLMGSGDELLGNVALVVRELHPQMRGEFIGLSLKVDFFSKMK